MADGTCCIPDCDRPAKRFGWCWRHYMRNREYGDPLAGGRFREQRDPICTYPGCEEEHDSRGYCRKHVARLRRTGDPSKVRKRVGRGPLAFIKRTEGCWYWTGAKDGSGYGQWADPETGKKRPAHRVIYELLVGPIPDGMTLDHECHNRDLSCPGGRICPHHACVRPEDGHNTPRTLRDNVLRGRSPAAAHAKRTHCPHGHPYDAANTRINTRGGRICKTCELAAKQRRRQRRRAQGLRVT